MTGYQETLTDPSYHRQVVVMTAPHVGNTGWNDEDDESGRIWVAGYVVRDPAPAAVQLALAPRRSRTSSTPRASSASASIDTRALTRHLRERGAMRVGIFSGDAASAPRERLLAQVVDSPPMAGRVARRAGRHRHGLRRAGGGRASASPWPASTSASRR